MTPMDWERPPARGSGPPNVQEIEELVKRLKERFKFLGGGNIWILALIVAALFIGLNSY